MKPSLRRVPVRQERSVRRRGLMVAAVLLAGGSLYWFWHPRGQTSPGVSATSGPGGTRPSAVPIRTTARLLSIRIMPANASVAKGLTARFSALGSYSDNEVRDITEEARWTASTSAVSLLQESPGLVKGVEVGVATVRAAVVDVAGAADLEVTAAALVAIAVEPATSIVAVGEGVKLAATGSYADGTTRDITDEADWESITPGVVLRSGKKGTALGAVEGTSVIAAKMGGIAGSAVVRVEPAIVTAINIVPINATAAVGETLHFQATSMSSSGSEQDITSLVVWHSSNAAVLKMGSTADDRNDGTALARGSVAITAAFSGLRGSTTLNVR